MPTSAAEAVGPLREAVRLEPEALRLLNDLAWILATHPDPAVRDAAEAIELARRAARLTRQRDPQVLDTLAAGYAAAGRLGEAIATAQRAVGLAPGDADLSARLELYLDGRPFVDPTLTGR